MVRTLITTAAKLAIACLVVGLILAGFDIRPAEVFAKIGSSACGAAEAGASALHWAWPYIALGAAVVIPIWLVVFVLRGGWRRR